MPGLTRHSLKVAVARVVRGSDVDAQRMLQRMERDGVTALDGDARTRQYSQNITYCAKVNETEAAERWMQKEVGNAIGDKEVEEVKALGYQRAIGMILWAARHVFPEAKHGFSQCCSVMAVPSMCAFKAAMHMIAYMVQRKDRGIEFNAQGKQAPVCMSDASNKGDKDVGLSYHGWVVMWAGRPIASASKKLTMVGTSSEHSEYMGMFYAIRAIVWLRQLMEEMDWDEYISAPTVVFGDNVCANRLCKNHFVSTRNQHNYTPYHWV